jgi:hypothetical protein
MKEQNSRNMYFPMLFGAMGIILLILAWLIPVGASDRIIAAAAGSAGLFVAVIRIPPFKRTARTGPEQSPVNIKTEDES